MSPYNAITKRVLKELRRSPECELEELVFSCREFTWHDTLIELVRLNQAGRVEMSKETYNLRLCFPRQLDLSRPRAKSGRRG